MTWIIYAILDCVATIIAYITNPIVVLFANEYGDLPYILRYWQTYDNPLDIEWVISEGCVPKCIRYNFNKHYRYTPEWDSSTGIGYVDILNPHFTIKERIQRYFCRLYWLYRNTAYGFSYEITGRDINGTKMAIIRNNSDEDWLSYDDTVGIWNRTWVLYYNKPWCSKFKLRVYLGWKGKGLSSTDTKRCMLALFVSPFRNVKD
jgi:hypothetical protein